MAETQQVIDQARRLGELIASHPAAQKLRSASERLEADTDAQRTLADYRRYAEQIHEKQQKQQPIEPEEKRKLEELHRSVIHNPLLSELQMAQMDYADLMRQVNDAMSAAGAPSSTGAS